MNNISNYPNQFDNDENLYLVYDSVRIPLGFDYYPGSTTILADGDISRFPPSGIITLVDQQSSPKERAVSFYYKSKTNREFRELSLLEDSIDCFKPKKLTYITLQAMANHREALKDAIIAIENFLGKKHETETETIFGRLNFMKKVLFAPKAWFEIEKATGVAPFTTTFTFAGSGNVGPVGDVVYTWKFNEEEIQTKESTIEKTFSIPANYTVSLNIKNEYGEDTVTFVDVIKVKPHAPDEISIKFLPSANQIQIEDKIRTPINQPVFIEAQKPNKSKVNNYTWSLNDDLTHSNSNKTKAMFAVGGYYDASLRTDTDLNSYRITNYENCIDVVEPTNLWVWTNKNQNIQSHEFGLISEVFKLSKNNYTVGINDNFIENDRQKFEFYRNNGWAKKDNLKSGEGGNCLLFWASGRSKEDSENNEKINFATYNGFADTYKYENPIIRPWNWASLVGNGNVYFAFGLPSTGHLPTLSLTNKVKTTYNIENDSVSNSHIDYKNLKNGAHDLTTNSDVLDSNYDAPHGHYSAYRTAWKDSIGYLLKNEGLGDNFNFKSFYKTEGTLGAPFTNIVKLPDMPGSDNKEGSLVTLNNGIYFFNNCGEAYCYNDSTAVWELVTPHNKLAKHDMLSLLASSDNESRAYITIEDTAFFKFNEIDMSYKIYNQGCVNSQWLVSVH